MIGFIALDKGTQINTEKADINGSFEGFLLKSELVFLAFKVVASTASATRL
jgi:hypothetical protein